MLNLKKQTLFGAIARAMLGSMPSAFWTANSTKEKREVNIHPMITSSPAEIAAWNANVVSRNQRKHYTKTAKKLKAQGVQNMPLA